MLKRADIEERQELLNKPIKMEIKYNGGLIIATRGKMPIGQPSIGICTTIGLNLTKQRT